MRERAHVGRGAQAPHRARGRARVGSSRRSASKSPSPTSRRTSEKPFACSPDDGSPSTTSPAATREPSTSRSRVTSPTQVPAKSSSPVAVDARHLRGLAAEQRAARLAADLRGALDERGDVVEVERSRRDVVEEEQRLGAGRQHVVHAVRGEVAAGVAQPPGLAREDELRPDAVGRGREQALVVEREEPGEPAQRRTTTAVGARRLRRGAQPLDHGVRRRERHARSPRSSTAPGRHRSPPGGKARAAREPRRHVNSASASPASAAVLRLRRHAARPVPNPELIVVSRSRSSSSGSSAIIDDKTLVGANWVELRRHRDRRVPDLPRPREAAQRQRSPLAGSAAQAA